MVLGMLRPLCPAASDAAPPSGPLFPHLPLSLPTPPSIRFHPGLPAHTISVSPPRSCFSAPPSPVPELLAGAPPWQVLDVEQSVKQRILWKE